MLLKKFQCDQERGHYREESARRHEGHWRCPFFVYCWEEGLTLPTVDNCPECNSFYREDRSHKKPCFDQRPRGPIIREIGDNRHISVHDRLGGRVSVHNHLGGRTMLRDCWRLPTSPSDDARRRQFGTTVFHEPRIDPQTHEIPL